MHDRSVPRADKGQYAENGGMADGCSSYLTGRNAFFQTELPRLRALCRLRARVRLAARRPRGQYLEIVCDAQ